MALNPQQAAELRAAMAELEGAQAAILSAHRQAQDRVRRAAERAEGEPGPGETRYHETPQQWEHVRAQRVKQARAQTEGGFVQLAQRLDAARARVEALAKEARMAPTPTMVADAERRAERVWPRVQRQLDAGVPLPELIANANHAEVDAMRAELPSYLRAQMARNGRARGVSGSESARPDVDKLEEKLDRRAAELIGGMDGQALQARYRARTLYQQAASRLRGVVSEVNGQGGAALAGAVGARLIGAQAAEAESREPAPAE